MIVQLLSAAMVIFVEESSGMTTTDESPGSPIEPTASSSPQSPHGACADRAGCESHSQRSLGEAAQVAEPALPAAQPRADIRPEKRLVGGVFYTDNYAWLEADSQEALEWQKRQSAYTDVRLAALDGASISREIAPLCAAAMVFAPQRCGDDWFIIEARSNGLVVSISRDLQSAGTIVCDPAAIFGADAALDYFFPSPTGRLLAIGISRAGDEQSTLHFMESASGRVLPQSLRFTSNTVVAWLPDESGLFCSAGEVSDFESVCKRLIFLPLDADVQPRFESVAVRHQYSLRPQVSQDGRWLAAMTSETEPRPDFIRALPDGPWRPFLVDIAGACYGVFVGDEYVAISNAGAPRGRLVSIPIVSSGDMRTWRVLIPEGDRVMRSIERVQDRLVICSYEDSFARLSVHYLDGALDHEIALPGDGVVRATGLLQHYQTFGYGGDNVVPGNGEITFTYSSFTRSPAVYHYALAPRRLTQLTPPRIEHLDIVHSRKSVIASDGSSVRYSILHRRDLDRTTPQPTLMYGYGGFNVSFVPGYLGVFAHFIDAGGIFVFCHLRGGAEFGAGQWRDSRFGGKRNTWSDLYALAEALHASGVTNPDRLALVGSSGGGMLAGGALAQRPELWRAVVSMVPLIDLMQFGRDKYAALCAIDLGDPANPEAAGWLYAMSPYHAVRAGRFPATLILAAANDMRTRPWHARKFAAILEAMNTGPHDVLLKVIDGVGHFGSYTDPSRAALWLAFLESELGLRVTRIADNAGTCPKGSGE